MIEQQTIDGREATIAYMDMDWNPVGKDDAELVKIVFDDGEMLFLTTNRDMGEDAWHEEQHPRGGDPENPGRFSKGQGGAQTQPAQPESSETEPAVSPYIQRVFERNQQLAQIRRDKEAAYKRQEAARSTQPTGTAPTEALPAPKTKYKVKVSDFRAGDVNIDEIRRDPDELAAFEALWDEKIGESPAEFHKEFVGGIPCSMKINYNDYSGEMTIEGQLKDDNDLNIGSYTRVIKFKQNSAYSDYFAIQHGQQKHNIGKKMLAANVAMYQKLGLDKLTVYANIDVGGYAWAKYGYVPTNHDWREISENIRDKLGGSSRRGGGGGEVPEEWDLISSDDQDRIMRAWMEQTRSEFMDSEIENWRDSGALEDAKVEVADNFEVRGQYAEWAVDALDDWRSEWEEKHDGKTVPFTNQQILKAIEVSYDSNRGDFDVYFSDSELTEPEGYDPNELTLPGIEEVKPEEYLTEEMRDGISSALDKAFDDASEKVSNHAEPPDWIGDNVGEYQEEFWESMGDRERYRWAKNNSELPTYESEDDEEEEVDTDDDEEAAIRKLTYSSDPKALWAIADSRVGKNLLLGTDWHGELNFHDKETMDRFNAYVGKAA